ncbi:MAG: methylenetetrahydrofolate--tRNA-(uracil(54)-C(5))-methyltransferase (FADH(2)-oxidizing) TrmFO [Chloroflexi bacterium]|nr:methylenetetrahydrofolate--tRNA-(uracil(54)-C(5))-methyltransferase (FADH(2)-oxidizing) TrmFO [Chloroflexota bacterium]
MSTPEFITVIGGGLAGTEAAWQIAQRGVRVRLHEMRPVRKTPAHTTDKLAELVCSNSFGADDVTKAPGLLKHEMRALSSLLIECATEATVPAGAALAVDRDVFAAAVTARIESHPLIEVVREEVTEIPAGIVIVASGPLTSPALAADIARRSGSEHLYFWDAIAPIVTLESVDFGIAFRASRYGKDAATPEGEPEAQGDYINCPMTKDEYYAFIDALIAAETAALREFELAEKDHFFEGCLPVEVLARRGRDALAYGPMRPVGIRDPRTNKRPYAVVQLRQDNVAGTLYNLVGFQTNLKFAEQDRVLRMIPGLGNAEFVRYGVMHRNTFINSPTLLNPTLRFRASENGDPLFFAGQIVGVEGYAGNAATGLLAGINAVQALRGQPEIVLPQTTMLGALCHYVTHCEPKHFQPMKAAFGIFPPLENPSRDKRQRAEAYSARACADLERTLEQHPELRA